VIEIISAVDDRVSISAEDFLLGAVT